MKKQGLMMIPSEIEDWQIFLEEQECDNIIDYGDWIMFNCVFHDQSDKSRPSLGVHKESGVVNCLGCGMHNWRELCEAFGISPVDFIDGVRENSWQHFKKKILGINERKRYKRYKLPRQLANPLGHKGAREYLIDRRGFDTRLLQAYDIRLCIDRDSRYYEHLIFPICDEKGVLFFDARYVGKHEWKTRWKRPKNCAYWKTYFNWENVKDSPVLLFAEGAPDALKLIQLEFPAIPAKNFSKKQIDMIRESNVKTIFLFYDFDEAGRWKKDKKGKDIHFTAKAQMLFSNCGIDVHVGILPKYAKDPALVRTRKDIVKHNPKLSGVTFDVL
jgi:hypothetical protein